MRCVWLAVIACAACVHPGAFTCKDGGTCPEGTVCADVTDPDEALCVPPEQLASCAGLRRWLLERLPLRRDVRERRARSDQGRAVRRRQSHPARWLRQSMSARNAAL